MPGIHPPIPIDYRLYTVLRHLLFAWKANLDAGSARCGCSAGLSIVTAASHCLSTTNLDTKAAKPNGPRSMLDTSTIATPVLYFFTYKRSIHCIMYAGILHSLTHSQSKWICKVQSQHSFFIRNNRRHIHYSIYSIYNVSSCSLYYLA